MKARRRPVAAPASTPKPARLSWPVHRDVALVFAAWSQRFRTLGSEAFAFLLVLEALRLSGPKPDRLVKRAAVSAVRRDVTAPITDADLEQAAKAVKSANLTAVARAHGKGGRVVGLIAS